MTTSWTGPQGAQRLDGGAAEQGEVADSDDLHTEADPVLRVLERADRGCDDNACLTAGVEDVTDQLAVSRRIMAGPYRPDYGAGSDIRLVLEQRIKAVADSIVEEMHGRLNTPESPTLGRRLQSKLESLRKEASVLGIILPKIRLDYQRGLRPARALSVEEEIELLLQATATVRNRERPSDQKKRNKRSPKIDR